MQLPYLSFYLKIWAKNVINFYSLNANMVSLDTGTALTTLTPLVLFAIGLVIYSIFIFNFYRFIATLSRTCTMGLVEKNSVHLPLPFGIRYPFPCIHHSMVRRIRFTLSTTFKESRPCTHFVGSHGHRIQRPHDRLLQRRPFQRFGKDASLWLTCSITGRY